MGNPMTPYGCAMPGCLSVSTYKNCTPVVSFSTFSTTGPSRLQYGHQSAVKNATTEPPADTICLNSDSFTTFMTRSPFKASMELSLFQYITFGACTALAQRVR